MTSPTPDHWQIQDAKQRFSEMIRAVTNEGPQVITRHGEDVAVVVDIGEYRRLSRPAVCRTGPIASSFLIYPWLLYVRFDCAGYISSNKRGSCRARGSRSATICA